MIGGLIEVCYANIRRDHVKPLIGGTRSTSALLTDDPTERGSFIYFSVVDRSRQRKLYELLTNIQATSDVFPKRNEDGIFKTRMEE